MTCWPDTGQWLNASAVAGGHIHSSYQLQTSQGTFFLQSFNEKIFPNPSVIERNLGELQVVNLDPARLLMPLPIRSTSERYFERSSSGDLWRVFPWIDSQIHKARNRQSSASQVAARFGEWAGVVNRLDPSHFAAAIEGFHHLPLIWEAFYTAWDHAGGDRKHRAAETCSRLAEGVEVLELFDQLVTGLPKRIIHGDPKADNQLKVKGSEAIAILDLDTVMPGYLWMEVGDMVRSMAALTDEDDPSLESAGINPDQAANILNGYTEAVSDWATEDELTSLRFGPLCIILEQALRFLTDYLTGDQYYQIEYPEHNFVRAQNQLLVWEAYADWVGY